MPIAQDLAGSIFGRLKVETFAGTRYVGSQRKRFWWCRCRCGRRIARAAGSLTTGNVRSCGCLLRDAITKHAGYKEPVYKVWHAMLERCRNANNAAYKDYGGRGIRVCKRWLDYAEFRTDMGPRPTRGMLERRDVNGNYDPSNCHWATPREQANNRRNNRLLTYGGVTRTTAEWARALAMSKNCILYRLANGWSIERALTSPPDRSQSNVDSRRLLQVK